MKINTVGLILFLLCCLFPACTAEKRLKIYKVLFDGVPDMAQTNTATQDSLALIDSLQASNTESPRINKPEFYFHEVYRERACDSCHEMDQGNELVQQPPELCFGCHDDFRETATFLHGPVSAGLCTTCHNPHFSQNEKMLLQSKEELCLNCHEAGSVYKNEVHEGVEPADCMECHNPHGSNEMYMLN